MVEEQLIKKRTKTFFRTYRDDPDKITESFFIDKDAPMRMPEPDDRRDDRRRDGNLKDRARRRAYPEYGRMSGRYGRGGGRRDDRFFRQEPPLPRRYGGRAIPQHYTEPPSRTLRSYRDVDFMPEEDEPDIDYGFGDYTKPPKFNL